MYRCIIHIIEQYMVLCLMNMHALQRSLQATPIFDQVADPETGKVTFTAHGGLDFVSEGGQVSRMVSLFLGGVSPWFPHYLEVSPAFRICWRCFLFRHCK